MSQFSSSIAFLCTSHSWGGLEINFFKWSLWSKNLSLKVDVECIVNEKSELSKKFIDYPNLSVSKIHRRFKKLDLICAYQLSKILKQKNIDKLLITSTVDIDLACWTKFFFPELQITYVQQMQLGVVKKNFYFNWKFSLLNTWISPLEWLKAQVLTHTNMDKSRVFLHPLPIDLSYWQDTSLLQMAQEKNIKSTARKIYNLEENSFIVGLFGRIDPGKRQLLALKAFHYLLQKKGKEFTDLKPKLLFVGNTTVGEKKSQHYYETLLEYITKNNLTPYVQFLGHQEDLRSLYRSLDHYLMPTPKESYGMVTLEAMASGTTVIGCADGGTKEILGDGKYGILFKADDEASLGEAIYKEIKNKNDQKNVEIHSLLSKYDYQLVLPHFLQYF
ncbi:MAG: glycosyltransferase family 4 protein [Bacteriovoracaceae bacterium]|nr:glycosyltransferase family 4 protein [Bacteriovoracaceae bacterium]